MPPGGGGAAGGAKASEGDAVSHTRARAARRTLEVVVVACTPEHCQPIPHTHTQRPRNVRAHSQAHGQSDRQSVTHGDRATARRAESRSQPQGVKSLSARTSGHLHARVSGGTGASAFMARPVALLV